MKVELDLPNWIDRQVIQIFAGIERIAYKYPDKPMMIKSGRCSMCGKCCMDLDNRHPFPIENGRCIYLEKEVGKNERWLCGLRINRPYRCCIGTGNRKVPECTEKYKAVKD